MGSRFLLFTEVGEELPDVANDHFSLEGKLGGDDVGQSCQILVRRDKKRSTVVTERKVSKVGKSRGRPPRKTPPPKPPKATARIPQKDAGDSWDDDGDLGSGVSAQDIRDALL